jgi:aldose 1-epimerase
VVTLENPAQGTRAEIWPAVGFNCFHWQTSVSGKTADVLFAAPDFLNTGQPTRNGVPILFPFPNRIRDGRFRWAGKEYQLPLNDPDQRNAIHGFACRRAWRVIGQGADEKGAWVRGEFRASMDALDACALWPADYRLEVTYRLGQGTLRIEALVENPDQEPLPFGLGYHPYFSVPFIGNEKGIDCRVQASASSYWELADHLPTGRRVPVDARLDLNSPRTFSDLELDDLLTGLPSAEAPGSAGLVFRGAVRQESAGIEIRVLTSVDFRELVVFTPPHRQAVCLEPYTCPTDAVNLEQRGIDAGRRVLQPGESWAGVVKLEVGEM